jgi:quinol monooxygenase YgiN
MEHLLVSFKVKKNKVEDAKAAIQKFVKEIQKKEPGTALYNCFQENNDETSFIDMMTFESEKAEEHHRHTKCVKDFVDELYPLCEEEPIFSELSLVCSNKSDSFK